MKPLCVSAPTRCRECCRKCCTDVAVQPPMPCVPICPFVAQFNGHCTVLNPQHCGQRLTSTRLCTAGKPPTGTNADELSGSPARTAAAKLAQPADAGGSPKMALYASAAPTLAPAAAAAASRAEWPPAPTALSGKPDSRHRAGHANVCVPWELSAAAGSDAVLTCASVPETQARCFDPCCWAPCGHHLAIALAPAEPPVAAPLQAQRRSRCRRCCQTSAPRVPRVPPQRPMWM